MALMIDPGLHHLQAQDTTNTPEESSAKEVQARTSSTPSTVDLTRSLPSTDIDNESIDEAYVQFIFYCNPSIALTTDTTELKRGFRSMPKTDGNCFDTFTLFQLIKKLEEREIETWSQLVIELGVEPPDTTKNQSSQKVQQFAVRLKVFRLISPLFHDTILYYDLTQLTYFPKRWLHAFHIDAFFQYCLGKPTPYSTNVPPAEESINDKIRDGVPTEEDLALRALLPEWRPKRGRRKLEANDGEPRTPSKRARRAGSYNTDDIITPLEAHSALLRSTSGWKPDDPWGVAQRALLPKSNPRNNQLQLSTGEQVFWVDLPDATPSTPYPQSAVTPRPSQSAISSHDTPQSAHPLSSGRTRKRHGPAVSAAWPSGGNTTAGKLPRGRPPNNRSVQDGPFSTFPVNAQTKAPVQLSADTPIEAPTQPSIQPPRSHPWIPYATITSPFTGQPSPGPPNSAPSTQSPIKKPSKLSLQVPQHAGGPVRLATPPPKVLVNGEDGNSTPTSSHVPERRSSVDFFNSLDEEASELGDESEDESERVDWKRRAQLLKRKLRDKEAELKAVRRRVMEAVM